MAAPEYYQADNLLGNIVSVISDRSGLSPEHLAHKIAEVFGDGDYSAAEDVLWDRIGPLIDEVQSDLGVEWAS